MVVKRLSTAVYLIQDQRGSGSRRRRRLVVHSDRLKPCPKGIRSDDVDSNDINRQEPESNATQEHSRGPRRPGTTLQLFDVDDEDEREEPAVHRNTEQQPIEAPDQPKLNSQLYLLWLLRSLHPGDIRSGSDAHPIASRPVASPFKEGGSVVNEHI